MPLVMCFGDSRYVLDDSCLGGKMPGERRSLQDLIRARQQSGFFGRQGEVTQFQENLMLPVDSVHRRFIFNIYGDAGVGKTYLTQHLRENARNSDVLTAYTDETTADPLSVMSAIADQFAQADERLSDFEKRAAAYKQRRYELESDPQAPEGLAAFLTKTTVVVALAAARDVPIAGSLLAPVDPAEVAEQANRARAYIARKFSDHADMSLLMSPTEELTQIFVRGLTRLGANRRLALFFDTYERTSLLLDRWLRDLYAGRYGELPATLVCTISGQYPLNLNLWGDYMSVISDVPLEAFTAVEARQFLASKGIADESIIDVILKISERLPMWLAALADARPDKASDVGDPAGDAVGRFLKWEEDPARRAIAVTAALPRTFNQDVLAFLGIFDNTRELFAWLIGLPFVSQQMGSWKYHDVARSAMIRLERAKSPNEWRANHLALANGYAKLADDLAGETSELWTNAAWVDYTCEKIYHLLCADPINSLPEALVTAVNATHAKAIRARQWAALFADAARDTDNAILRQWAQRLRSGIHDDDDDLAQYFTSLINNGNLAEEALITALMTRSRIHRMMKRYNEALADLDRVLDIDWHNAAALASRAGIYKAMERYDEALADLERSIEIDAGTTNVFVDRALAYRRIRRYDEALADFDRVIKVDPDDIWSRLFRGVVYKEKGLHDEALTDFDRSVKIDPDNAFALQFRGSVYQQMGRNSEALADLDRAIEIDPDSAIAISTRAWTYLQMERYDEALADFDRAIELDPNNAWYFTNRGLTYLRMKRYDEALADFDRAIELDPDNTWYFANRGLTYLPLKRYDEALADLDCALAIDPSDSKAFSRRGWAYMHMERYDEALADFDRALEINPDDTTALSGRSLVYTGWERYDDALAGFDRALEIIPDDPDTLVRRGWTYEQMERYDEALADLDRALEINPDDTTTLYRRGLTYEQMERYDEALADLDRALEINPDDTTTLSRRGWLRKTSHRYDEALADFDRAIELDPINVDVIIDRGRTYRDVGRYNEALADFDRALEMVPDDATTLSRRGETYLMSGSYDEALTDLGRAVEMDPSIAHGLADTFVSVAVDYLAQDKPEVAAAIFETVIRVSPTRATAYNNYAFCLLPIDPRRALKEFEAADELCPDRLLTIANKVLALHLLGRDAEALALGNAAATRDLPSEDAFMWNINDDHKLQLGESGDVKEYLQNLRTHIERHAAL